MKKHILILGLLLSLSYLPGLAQLSFGIKLGGTTMPELHFNENRYYERGFALYANDIAGIRSHAMDTFYKPGVNFFTHGEHLLSQIDSFTYDKSNHRPINIEAAVYLSMPISRRARLRLEVAHHQYSVQLRKNKNGGLFDFGGIHYITSLFPPSHTVSVPALPRDGNAILLNVRPGTFIRPSLHLHYYLFESVALNVGASLSLPLRKVEVQGFYHTLRMFYPDNNFEEPPAYLQITERIRPTILDEKMIIPGFNAGFVFNIRGLPKMEVRGSFYWPTWDIPKRRKRNRFEGKERELTLPLGEETATYRTFLHIEDSYFLSLFVEL